jgi:hypothetical protein
VPLNQLISSSMRKEPWSRPGSCWLACIATDITECTLWGPQTGLRSKWPYLTPQGKAVYYVNLFVVPKGAFGYVCGNVFSAT